VICFWTVLLVLGSNLVDANINKNDKQDKAKKWEEPLDPSPLCDPNPCKNGGICNGVDGSCLCVNGMGGAFCETKLSLSYKPKGPQNDVPLSKVVNGGWKLCYNASYKDTYLLEKDLTPSILDGTTKVPMVSPGPWVTPGSRYDYIDELFNTDCKMGKKVMMACGSVNAGKSLPDNLMLLAWGPRDVVLKHTGRPNQGNIANGVRWYRTYVSGANLQLGYNSWGFAPGNSSFTWDISGRPDLPSGKRWCEVGDEARDQRMCWITGTQLSASDYYCGKLTGPDNYYPAAIKFHRLIFVAD